jgi:hypothetical protein
MLYNTIVGEDLVQKVDLSVPVKNAANYEESHTFTASVPIGVTRNSAPDEYRKWKWPETDKSSFTKIKKSGAIKFSSYSTGEERVENLVGKVVLESYANGYPAVASQYDNKLYASDTKIVKLANPYYLQGDLSSFGSMFPHAPYHLYDYDFADENSEIESVKGAVVSSMNSEYDFLTEMAELKETLAYLLNILNKVRHPLQSFKDAKKALDKKNWKGKSVEYHDAVTSLWMQYRYAIMPLVYSAQDIKSVIEHRSDLYRTEREKSVLDLNINLKGDEDVLHFYDKVEGKSTVRAVGKARYGSEVNLRLIDSIGTNFATTAWELIPFSFVVDWFVNIGDFLSSHLSSWASLAEERHFVWSVKREYSISTYLHYYNDARGTVKFSSWSYGGSVVRPETSWDYGRIFQDEVLLRKKTVTSYSREVFSPSDVRLTFSPFMNWKRWLDAYVLSSGNARNLLRKLKS